jgi:hypothetical protein
MARRPKTIEETVQATGEALHLDMKTINRSEELLVRARRVRREIEERVRALLDRDRRHGRPRTP